MIVDIHYHQIPMLPEEMAEYVAEGAIRAARIMGIKVDPQTIIRKAAETIPDPTGERLIALMERSGIDFTCICAVDNAGNDLFTPELTQLQNRMVGEIAQKYPDKVMALAGVDPRRPNAVDMLKQCVEEFGMKGLKYHCDFGYDPSGPDSYKLLEIVQENAGILLTHTGPHRPPSRSKYTEPILLADISVDFPELKVIAAHMGQMNWRPWAALATQQPNLYGDLAMWDPFALGHYEMFCRDLRDLINYADISKVLFGTDNPIYELVRPTRDWVQQIKDLPVNAPAGITFTEKEVTAILGGNAASILGLTKET